VFLQRCIGIEKLIQLRTSLEKEMNVYNYDSGPGVEEIIREELAKICPKRYSVKAGVITDRDGKSAGDFDVILFNELWFPQVKAGATEKSRRVYFPIEGVYAVGEVKQTLDFKSLDTAMKKLVCCHRLNRPRTDARRLTENRESSSCIHGLSNPLYSFIIASDIKEGITFVDLVERFFLINTSLKRLDVVRGLCIIGYGTVIWGFKNPKREESKPALFMMEDLYLPLVPVKAQVPEIESALYYQITDLLLHLFHSVLAPEDVAVGYGSSTHKIQIPSSDEFSLQPDDEWLEIKNIECTETHDMEI